MASFRHHPDGLIYINDVYFLLSDFLIEEPSYSLPPSAIGREYDGIKDRAYGKKREFDGNSETELDGYISNVITYQKNVIRRNVLNLEAEYASDISEAKERRIKELRFIAAKKYFDLVESDLEIGSDVIVLWKNELISHSPIFEAEVNALTTVFDVISYNYNAWPVDPVV